MTKPKPKLQTRIILNYHDSIEYIEEKYKINTDDYKGHLSKPSARYEEMIRAAGVDRMRMWHTRPAEMTPAERAVHDAYEIEREQIAEANPYCDFWHWIIDTYNVSNGSTFTMNCDEILSGGSEAWVKEIVALIKQEFGKEIEFEVWW